MPVGDVIQARYICQSGQQVGLNIRHYRIEAITGTEHTRDRIAFLLSGRVHTIYKALLSSTAEFIGVAVKRLLPIPVTAEETSFTDRGPGIRGGDALPGQVTGLISLRTGLAGRRNRGRLYPPFPAEVSSSADARPVLQYQTDLATLASEFFGTITITFLADSMTLRNVIHRVGSTTTVNITSAPIVARWATQRRRGDLGRPNPPVF